MKIFTSLSKIPRIHKSVLALGVFDGVHRGHRRIIHAAVAESHRLQGPCVVITFWPHPHQEKMLYSLEHRLRLLEELGVDQVVVLRYSASLANMPADEFLRRVIIKSFAPVAVYVGENFRFGKGARGNTHLLSRYAAQGIFKLRVIRMLSDRRGPISSTRIRTLIMSGDLQRAERLLGRRVSVWGTVIAGNRRGRTLGFPTANLNPHHEVVPPPGIYAVQALISGKKRGGACYIGTRPTFSASRAIHVEAYIFGVHQSLYGRGLELQFLRKIRNDRSFPSAHDLVTQMGKDILLARRTIKSIRSS